MKLKILSRKTSGGLFVEFEIHAPGEREMDHLSVDPPGETYLRLMDLEVELRATGEICESPGTGLREHGEFFSEGSYASGGCYEVRDEAASDTLIARIEGVFSGVEAEVEYL